MGIFDGSFFKHKDPDAVVPLTTNVSNYIYLDGKDPAEFDLFQDVAKFVAKEFTKVKVTVTPETPNRGQIDYLLNLKPNHGDSANTFFYEFAYSMLRTGQVWYKFSNSGKQPTALFVSRVKKPGYKLFKSNQLKLRVPSDLIEKYSDLLATLSTQHSSNVMEIQSNIKTNDASPEGEGEMDKKIHNRLQRVKNNMREFGIFFTNPNESTKDHANLTQPDGTALEDLRAMIYQQLHISPKMLDGSYTESDYRAFYATHLQPLSGALEELLNGELLTREQWLQGSRIEVILDLLQFATLESFTQMAKEGIYSGYLTLDGVRHSLGMEAYPDGIGQIIFSNKNAVALNNPEINAMLATGGATNENEDTSDTTSDQQADN